MSNELNKGLKEGVLLGMEGLKEGGGEERRGQR